MTPGPQRARDTRSSAARVVVFFVLGLMLLWLVLKGQNVTLIRGKLAGARWGWALLSLVFAGLSQLVRAARWNLLIHPLGYRPRFANTLGALLVGYMANLAIPRAGELTRCIVLNRYERIPFDNLVGTVVTERIVDVITVLIFLALVLVLAFDRMSSIAMQYVVDPIRVRLDPTIGRGPMIYLAIGGAVVVLLPLVVVLYRHWRQSPHFARLASAARGFMIGVRTIQHLEDRSRFVVFSIFIWVLYALMAYACFSCFPATAALGVTAALAVLVFGGLGFAAPVQGGLGAFEIIVTPAVMAFGIPTSDALAYAILYHATQVAGMTIFGLVALLSLPIANARERTARLVGQ